MRYSTRTVRGFIFSLSSIICALAFCNTAHAAAVYGTDASGELTGSRSVDGGGLSGFGDYATDFAVSWEIIENAPNDWTYKYTFSEFTKDISHFTLDLTDDCAPSNPGCVTNLSTDGTGSTLEFGDKDDIVGAVKFDFGSDEPASGTLFYQFDSNRAPVYGHLFIKSGGGKSSCLDATPSSTIACNNGLRAGFDTEDILDYVARPNGAPSAVPVPAAIWLLSSGLIALFTIGRTQASQA